MLHRAIKGQSGTLNVDNPATPDQMDTLDPVTYNPLPLIDLSARITVKHFSASDLDQRKAAVNEATMLKVVYHSFPMNIRSFEVFAGMTDKLENWKRAMELEQSNIVKEMYQIGFMVTAHLTRYQNCIEHSRLFQRHAVETYKAVHGEIKVSLLIDKQKIVKTTCSECPTVWCEHVLASIIHRIKYKDKVTMHAPMTESLSSLSRDQLQKLLQYAVNDDPAGIMGTIFKHYKEIRDNNSEINAIDGAPDPSYESLKEGEISQWELSLDLLNTRVAADLTISVNYPDNYDITKKKNSKLFPYINLVTEFIREKEYLSAAQVMQILVINTTQQMKTITRSSCPSLSRWWHDLSHIHALLVLRTEDKEARNVLMSTVNKIIVTPVMMEHILQASDWSEFPSLTKLFSHETEKLSTEGCMMIESVLANQLQPNPQHLQRLLDGTDNCENTSYTEDLIVMLTRLESMFYFDKNGQKILRFGFLILRKLSIQSQKHSVLGQFNSLSSGKSDSGAPFSLIKLFCPGPPATSTKQEPESLVSSSSSNVQPMDTDSQPYKAELCEGNVLQSDCHLAHAMLYTLLMIFIESGIVRNLGSSTRKVLVGFCLQALELSRYRAQAAVNKPELNTSSSWLNSFNHANSSTSNSSSQSDRPMISFQEYEWCSKLEATVSHYLEMVRVEEIHEAASMYIDCMCAVGLSYYTNTAISLQNDSLNICEAYPILLLETVYKVFRKDSLKESKSQQLKKIYSEIILGTTSSQVYNSLLRADLLQKLLNNSSNNSYFSFLPFNYIIDAFCRNIKVRKFHDIIDTFVSLVVTDSPEDIHLLTKTLYHLEYIRSYALLKLISTVVHRTHFWGFSDKPSDIKSALSNSISTYEKALGASTLKSSLFNSNSVLKALMKEETFETSRNIHKDVVLYFFKKLHMSDISIFSNVWQYIFTCKDLQDLLLYLDVKDKEENSSSQAGDYLTPEVLSIINEFYDAKLYHDDDACTLLTRYFTPGSDHYKRIVNKIISNSENYHRGALFHLVRLHLSVSTETKHSTTSGPESFKFSMATDYQAIGDDHPTSSDDGVAIIFPMSREIFDIVEKAFERLGSKMATLNIIESVELVFNSCVLCGTGEHCSNITSLQFYDKLIQCICLHCQCQPQIIIKVLQRIDFICGGTNSSYLAQHESTTQLRAALLVAYRKYFEYRIRICLRAEYKDVIQEMVAARAECKIFIHNGDMEFDKEVVQSIRIMHSTKKEFIYMLNNDYPFNTEVNSN